MLHFRLRSPSHQAHETLTLLAAESRDSTLLQTWARVGGLPCFLCWCWPCTLVWGWWTSKNIKSRKNKLSIFPGLPNTAPCGLCRRKSRFHRFHLSWPAPASTLLTPRCRPPARAALSCRMHTGGKCCVFIPHHHHHHFVFICPFSVSPQVLWLHFWYNQKRAGAGVEQKLANRSHWADWAAGVDHITWLWMQRVPQFEFWWIMWVTSLLERSLRVFQAAQVRKFRLLLLSVLSCFVFLFFYRPNTW